jgi:MEMO1 family protein
MLRDTEGVSSSHLILPVGVLSIVGRFNGALTCEEIAREASSELNEPVGVDFVVNLANELEQALFVDGAPYKRERARIEREFAAAHVRPASHAGGAYHGEATKLAEYIDRECLGARKSKHAPAVLPGHHGLHGRRGHPAHRATPKPAGASGASGANGANGATSANGANCEVGATGHRPSGPPGGLVGLVAPHIDPWRGAQCYGHAYGALAHALPKSIDTFVLFGTSHAPMREPFALCRKTFATPLGPMEADFASIDAIASASDFDVYADQFNHKREHSLEFQAVFLRHLLGPRKARIIPILAGLGDHQRQGRSPAKAEAVERFFDAVRKVIDATRAVVIAGADLAHVGPRFGDPRALEADERQRLDAIDRASLERAEHLDAEAFWEHVASDLDTRRVCGLAPIYSLLRTISPRARGSVEHYEQTVDPDEGSIVSHAAVAFYV